MPNSFHRLEFQVDPTSVQQEAQWLVRILNGDGMLPYDGALEGEWQRIVPDRSAYSHSFLTPADAVEMELWVRHPGEAPRLMQVEVAALDQDSLLLNADFSDGLDNHSGWTEFRGAALIEDGENGGISLLVNQNGYALSDFFPVKDGGGYTFAPGVKTWPGVSILAYDANKRLIDRVPRIRENDPPLRMPEGSAYARILINTSHDHIPDFRTNTITHTGLVEVDSGKGLAEAILTLPAAGEIVLSPNSDPREERAAKELQYWIRQISGETLPLLARPSELDNKKFFIGSSFAGRFADDLDHLAGGDGFAVRRDGDAIYIFGAHPRGTLFGVYALLQRNTDIIWPRPNPDLQAVFTPQPYIEFSDTDFREQPKFEVRHISRGRYGVMLNESHIMQDWKARNLLNSYHGLHQGFNYLLWRHGGIPGYSGAHISWVGDAKEEDHNFYPLVDGERQVSVWREPCYTYPKTVDAIVQRFRERIALLPEADSYYLEARVADNWTVCACDDCLAPIRLDDGSYLEAQSMYSNQDPLFFSTRHFKMLNQVAERLVEEYPDLKIHTHAYIFTAEPPRVKVHPAIVPGFAAYPTKNERFPILSGQGQAIGPYTKDVWKRRFQEWGAMDHVPLGFFGYYYTPGFNALADTAAVDYRDLHGFGGIHAHTEGFPVDGDEYSMWDADGIEKWVIAQLMWDPYQDPQELREVYIQRVYHEAAPQMGAFYDLIRESWHAAPPEVFVNCHSSEQHLFEAFILKPGIEEQARALLADAVEAARHPQAREYIRRTIGQFNALADSLGRNFVPYVEESTLEWDDPVSMHWEKASVLRDFKKVDDWRVFENAPADHQTEVNMMHDRNYLYVRMIASSDGLVADGREPQAMPNQFPPGDRVELILDDGRRARYYLAAGPDGHFHAHPALEHGWQGVSQSDDGKWMAMLKVPLEVFQLDAEQPVLQARFGRVYRGAGEAREESSLNGAGIFNIHQSLWSHLNIN